MRTMCSREIFTKKCRQQQIFDSDLKGAWHYNHVTFTPIAKNFMLYCRLIYMLSILCVRLTIKVKVGIPESFKVGWYPPKKLGQVTLSRIRCLLACCGGRVIVQNSELCDGENTDQHLSRPKSTRKFRWFRCCLRSNQRKRKRTRYRVRKSEIG